MRKIFTFVVDAVVNSVLVIFLLVAVNILPDSPFEAFIKLSSFSHIWDYLKYINYFIPIPKIITTLEAWVMCIMEWYLWRFIYDISKNVSSGGTELMKL